MLHAGSKAQDQGILETIAGRILVVFWAPGNGVLILSP